MKKDSGIARDSARQMIVGAKRHDGFFHIFVDAQHRRHAARRAENFHARRCSAFNTAPRQFNLPQYEAGLAVDDGRANKS